MFNQKLFTLFVFCIFVCPSTPSWAATSSSNDAVEWIYQRSFTSSKKRKRRKVKSRLTKNFRVHSHRLRSTLQIKMNLNNRLVPVVREHLIAPSEDNFTWTGIVADQEDSIVAIHSQGDVITGQVHTQEGHFRIYSPSSGVYRLIKQSPPLASGCATENHGPASSPIESSDPTAMPLVIDDNDIRILILYTEDAMKGAAPWWNNRNPEWIESEINVQMHLMNQAFTYSWTDASAVLADSVQIDLEEDQESIYDYRAWLQEEMTDPDSEIYALRQTYKADIVSLWLEDGVDACGVSYIKTMNRYDSPDYGAHVVDRNCHFKMSFTHELGHNLGLRHDGYMDSTNSPYRYAHGWISYTGEVRSIMAYDDACESAGFPCPRINRFSNPDLTINGAALGNSSIADNARVVDILWQDVANYKRSRFTSMIEISMGTSD